MKPGEVINNSTLRKTFSVGNMGGMRRSRSKNLLVIVSDHTNALYDDYWADNVLHYTGMGLKGPQKLAFSQNRTLSEAHTSGVAVHLFEVFEPGQYIYAGEVELAGEPYQEDQTDSEGHLRAVWMFPVRLKPGGVRPMPSVGVVRQLEEIKQRALKGYSKAKLKELAKKAKSKPAKRSSLADDFVRNPYVAVYVKMMADGHCDLCQKPAPFQKDGQPFFHCHHVLWLARGGPDIIQNTVALCPNCHERMHQLDRKADIVRLSIRMAKRDPDLPVFDVTAATRHSAA
jgi:5-methylcytosine-specific restriction protein A